MTILQDWYRYGYTKKEAEKRLRNDPKYASLLRVHLGGIVRQQQFRLMTRLQERITDKNVRWKGSPTADCVAICTHVGLSSIAVHLADGKLEWWMHGAYSLTADNPHGQIYN